MSPKILRSVQTSFSSIDLSSSPKSCQCNRKIKSQEDIRAEKEIPNELLEWIKEVYSDEVSTKFWHERMKRLAYKLTKPGGEEKIREKILTFLKRVPRRELDCDEEQKEFLAQLPDILINKLKETYLKSARNKHRSPIRIYRIEIPTSSEKNSNKNELRQVIKNWLNNIPIKKKDFFDRSVNREDLLNFLAKQLQSYIPYLGRPDKCNKKIIIKHVVKNFLETIPMKKKCGTLLNELAATLVDNLFQIKSRDLNHDYKLNIMEDNILHQARDISESTNISVDVNSQSIKELIKHQIKSWLEESSLDDLFKDRTFQDKAVKNFAEDIIDRHKYLTIYPNSSYANELQYLKYQIFKWINKVVGEDNLETMICAPKLMNRIQNILNSELLRNEDETYLELKTSISLNECTRSHVVLDQYNRLYEETGRWLTEILKFSNDSVTQFAKELVNRVRDCIMQNTSMSVNEVIETEVDAWIRIINTINLRSNATEQLKQSLKTILKEKIITSKDPKRERRLLRMYEDIIDDWLDTSLFEENQSVESICNRDRNELIHDLAEKLLEIQYSYGALSKLDALGHVKQVILEWTTKIQAIIKEEIKLSESSIVGLIHAIQSCPVHNENVNHENCSQIVAALKNWINALLLHENASIGEKRRLMDMFKNLASRLSSVRTDISTDILQFIRMVWHSNTEDNNMNQETNLDTYLQELNLYAVEPTITNHPNLEHVNNLQRSENNTQSTTNFAVYGFTLPSNPEKVENKTGYFQNDSIKPITDADIEANQDLYTKHLVAEIDEWLNGLNVPQIHDTGFREIVVNDLAGDIIDRKKYLELNPSSKEINVNEVDQLRYQIFKWINKLVGEERQETLEHATDLMDRIKSIPIPMFTNRIDNNQDILLSRQDISNHANVKNYENVSNDNNRKMTATNVRLSCPLGFTTGPIATSSKRNDNPFKDPESKSDSGTNTQDKSHSRSVTKKLGISKKIEKSNHELDGTSNRCNKGTKDKESIKSIGLRPSEDVEKQNTLVEHLGTLPQGMTLQELYQYFDAVFKNKIQELPLETPTPDQEQLANLARVGIYNGIWKTFYTFLEDPEIANDYCLFELLFDEKLHDMLDCLPQTQDIQRIRPGWKSAVLNDILVMLQYVHSISDKPNIKEMIQKRVDRQLIRNMQVTHSDRAQHCFVARTADGYILSSRYKDEDPVRANIYRQRLMKRLEELAESVKHENKIQFNEISPPQFCQLAFKVLAEVPIPDKEELEEEAEEVLLGQEIEEWYKDLPVRPVANENNAHLRRRLRELLAQRLRDLEKRIEAFGDPSLELERDMKHEISKYLEKDAELKQVNDLNINFMVEELTNRIKNRRQNNMLGYEAFEKENPASSTFVQADPGEIMAPLVDIKQNFDNQNSLNISTQPNDLRLRAYSIPANNISSKNSTGAEGQRFSLPTDLSPCCQQRCDLRGNTTIGPQGYATNQNEFSPNVPRSSVQLSSGSSFDNAGTAILRPSFSAIPNNYLSVAPQQTKSGQESPCYYQGRASQGQPSHGLSSATGTSMSTARLGNGVSSAEPQAALEDLENDDKVRYKCHCMERLPVCSKRHRQCDYMNRYPPCYPPMPRRCYE